MAAHEVIRLPEYGQMELPQIAQAISAKMGRPVSIEELSQIAEFIPEAVFDAAIDRSKLSPAQKSEIRELVKAALDDMSPEHRGIVAEGLRDVHFFSDSDSLKSEMPEKYRRRAGNDEVGGVRLPDGTIMIDGVKGLHKLTGHATASIREVVMHETGHTVAEKMGHIDLTKEWEAAASAEAKPNDKGEYPLTPYAYDSAFSKDPLFQPFKNGVRDFGEAFAEFYRKLYGTDIPTAQIAADHPLMSAFFKAKGLWPVNERAGKTGTKRRMDDIFDKSVPLEQGSQAHVDTIKESPVPDRAPEKAPEKVPPVGEWRDLAKAAGLTDQDITVIDILGRNLGDRKAAVEKVAKQFGLTPKAASAAVTKAVNRLGATSKRQKADEFALSDSAKETLKTLFPDAKQYKLMENRMTGSLRDTADKMSVSQEFVRKQQDKLLVEMGFPPGEEGIEQLRRKIAKTEKRSAKEAVRDKARIRRNNALTPDEEAIANEELGVNEQRKSAADDYLKQRAEQDRLDMENPQFMRRPDEPMSETERVLLAGIHEDPLDITRRLILADAIEEGGSPNAAERAEAIRGEIANPPGEKGVSDWRQAKGRTRSIIYGAPDNDFHRFQEILAEEEKKRGVDRNSGITEPYQANAAYDAAYERFFAERERSGKRLEFSLPKDPNVAFPEGMARPLYDFGPRLWNNMYGHSAASRAQTILFGDGFGTLNYLRTLPHSTNIEDSFASDRHGIPYSDRVRILFDTEHLGGLSGELSRYDEWRRDYDRGDAEVALNDPDNNSLSKGVLSVFIQESHPDNPGNRGEMSTLRRRLLDAGFRPVEMPNKVTRFDSPLRQQLREQQARGLRTGDPMFMLGGAVKKAKEVLDRAPETKAFLKQLLTGPGKLPRSAFEESLLKDQKIVGHFVNVEHTAQDLTKAIGGDWRRVPKPVIEAMNETLQIKPEVDGVANPAYTAAVSRFKPEIGTALRRMRGDIDALSNELIKSGALTENLKAVFESNLGTYLTRQYRAFTDPDWYDTLKKMPDGQEIINRAKAWFDAEARKAGHILSDEQLDGEIEAILKNDTKHDNPLSFITHSKLGSKDLGILKPREELPEPLRALLGEIKDPIANYAASVGRMANLLENHVFQTRVKEVGLKEGFFSRNPKPGMAEELAPLDSKTMSGLRGLYTTKEIREAFEQHYHKEQLPKYMSAYMKALGVAKYAKTVLSPTAHLRQTLGNAFFNIANGHTVSAEANKMLKEMWKKTDLGRAYERRLTELGVIDQSVHGNELKALVDDASKTHDPFTMSTHVTENAIVRWLKKGLNLAQKSYRWEDNLVKVHAFENEKATLAKAYPDKPNSWHEEQAALKVQATFPTWSRLPGGIKWLRRFPLVGPFVSFTSEVVRTTYNTAKIAREEMKSDNAVIRKQGAKRMVGLMVSMSAFAAVSAMSRMLSDVTLDEEDSMRRFLPEWNRDSQLLHLGKDSSGKRLVIDMGRTDPHSYLWEPFQAGISGARSGTGTIWDTMEPALKPFIGEEIGTRTLFDIARNKQEQGGGKGEGMIYNPESSTLAKGGAIGAHILKGLEPGAIDEILRTVGAAVGVPPNPGGKQRDVGEELLADFTGQRLIGLDAKESLKFAAKTFQERQKNAEREVNQLVARNAQQGVRLKPEDVQAEFSRGESMRRQVFDDLLSDVQAAKMLGMTNGDIARELKKAGVSQEAIGAVLGGRYQPRNLGQVLNRR